MVQESAVGVRSIYNINSSCQDQVPPPSTQSHLVPEQRQTNHCGNGSIGSEIIRSFDSSGLYFFAGGPFKNVVSNSLSFDFQGSLVTR